MRDKQPQHTPGPLAIIEIERRGRPTYDIRAGISTGRRLVATAYLPEDAIIIAAAPDLLAALKALHNRLITESMSVPDDDDFLALERASMAAIARAEGR